MKILDRFFKTVKNNSDETQNKENIDIKESSNNEFINTLKKQVIQKAKTTSVETAIRPGDGLGMNTKIGN